MDDNAFIERGDIVPDPEKLEEYAMRHKGLPFEAAAAEIAQNINGKMVQDGSLHLQVIYACLLKIGILQHDKISPIRKLDRLYEFFHNETGVFMARE